MGQCGTAAVHAVFALPPHRGERRFLRPGMAAAVSCTGRRRFLYHVDAEMHETIRS